MSYEKPTYTIGQFLRDAEAGGYVSLIPTAQCPVADLRGIYESWCSHTGREPMTAKRFGITLSWAGYPSVRGSRGIRAKGGIRIN